VAAAATPRVVRRASDRHRGAKEATGYSVGSRIRRHRSATRTASSLERAPRTSMTPSRSSRTSCAETRNCAAT
jgi:hypothetical protein